MAKKFFVGISQIDEQGEPTLDQWINGVLECSCTAPTTIVNSHHRLPEAMGAWESALAKYAQDIDGDWRTGLEAVLAKELISLGVVNQMSGIGVFEIVTFGRSGRITAGPRRFYVLQTGTSPALYASDTLAAAFGAAKDIAATGQPEDPSLVPMTWPTPSPRPR